MPDQMFDGGASPMMGGMDAEGVDPMIGADPDMGGMVDLTTGTQDQYGADFDAGVEADEQTDPKKFIQQLTGKLSQSLRKYNEGLPQPDADLNKYVAGMVVKQCIEGLPQEDIQEILDKVENDDQEQMQMDNGQGMEQPMDQNMQQPMTNQPDPTIDQQGGMPMNENSAQRQAISSRYNQFTNDEEGTNEKVPNRNSYHKRPWVGKTFKS